MNTTQKYKSLDVKNFAFLTHNFQEAGAKVNEAGTELHLSLDKHQADSFERDFPGLILYPLNLK